MSYTPGYPLLFFFQRKSEIPDSIIIGYPFYNTLQRFFIIGIFPVLHPAADELTQNPAEVFMPGLRQEAPGIRKHSDEIPQQPQISEGSHLLHHPILIIVKPPCGALLYFSHGIRILEAADNTAYGFIIIGIQAVNYGFGKGSLYIQGIKKIRHLAGGRIIIDTVISCIRS